MARTAQRVPIARRETREERRRNDRVVFVALCNALGNEMSKPDLAAKLGVHYSTLMDWLSGEHRVPPMAITVVRGMMGAMLSEIDQTPSLKGRRG